MYSTWHNIFSKRHKLPLGPPIFTTWLTLHFQPDDQLLSWYDIPGEYTHQIPLLNQKLIYSDVIMRTIAFQITSITIVYSTVYLGVYKRKYQSSASLAFVGGIHMWPVNSPHKGPTARTMFPFDEVTMCLPIKDCRRQSAGNLSMLLKCWWAQQKIFKNTVAFCWRLLC